jgi:hypothetical protein
MRHYITLRLVVGVMAGRGGADGEEERSHLLEGSLRAMYKSAPSTPSAPPDHDPEYRRMMCVRANHPTTPAFVLRPKQLVQGQPVREMVRLALNVWF